MTMLTWMPLLAALSGASHAQDVPAEALAPPAEEAWAISIAIYGFDPQGEPGYLSPIVRADQGALHVEAHYNYEEVDTASLFFGRNFSFGDELTVGLTPMIGAVVGEIDGLAPALALEVAWKGFLLTSESEYVIDFEDEGDDFLYSWNELTFAPADWVRFGLVGQRTRVFDQELDVDRGLLLGFAFRELWLDFYLFNLDVDEPYAGFGIGVDF
jgi:hypothetical protein